MRRLLISLALALTLALTLVGSALGHVHGLTPLRCVGVADDGANQVDNTPASAANGGPIFGLIPGKVPAGGCLEKPGILICPNQ